MSTRSASIPSYRKHKASGQAIVTLSDGLGTRKDFPAVRFRCHRLLARYRGPAWSERRVLPADKRPDTVRPREPGSVGVQHGRCHHPQHDADGDGEDLLDGEDLDE